MREPMPYIAPWRAVLLIADQGDISAEEAVQLLGVAFDGGEIEPDWPDGRPAVARSDEIDWRSGLLRRRRRLQTHSLAEEWETPVYTEHDLVWPFRLRRGDVEALIAERFSAPPPAQNEEAGAALRSKGEQLKTRMARYLAAHGAAALAEIPVKTLAEQFGGGQTLAFEIRRQLLARCKP